MKQAIEVVTGMIQEKEKKEFENKILGMVNEQKSTMERGERNPLSHINQSEIEIEKLNSDWLISQFYVCFMRL